LLEQAGNLWLVCQVNDNAKGGTRVFNKKYDESFVISDKQLWDIRIFTAQILGG
jgi:hypothetical protein